MIGFNEIPSNLRVPLFYVEFDASQTGNSFLIAPSLLIGQKLAGGSATANQPVQVSGTDQARAYFGSGSMLARMVEAFRKGDSFSELWCLPLDDNPAGAAATGTLALTGTALAAGTVSLYVAGQRLQLGVTAAQTAAAIATALAALVNANVSLPVTAAAETGTVTFTARHKGALGNDIDLRLNYRGPAGGEALPAGLGVTITAMAGGATEPSLDAAIANMGDEPFDHIGLPYTDSASLDAIGEALGHVTGRWAWDRQIYGHAYTARRGSVAVLGTHGNGRNDPHVTILGFDKSPTPPWEWAAALTAQASRALNLDPARPLQSLGMPGLAAPVMSDRPTLQELNTLLYDGIATYAVASDGGVQLQRVITTYQKNAFGDPHTAWLDVTTPATLTRSTRRFRSRITTRFPRHKLADDGDYGRGDNVATPAIIRAEILAEAQAQVRDGLIENYEAFEKALIVERDANDPNRVNVLMQPDLVNQLNIFAMRNQFLLQAAA